MSRVLRIDGLWKCYASGVRGCSARVWVLRGLSMSIEPGERVIVVGRPGAGKCTLRRCIVGLLRPDAGCIEAPGLANGTLVVTTAKDPGAHSPPVPGGALLQFGNALPHDNGAFDRILLLRDGRLHPERWSGRSRRVAER